MENSKVLKRKESVDMKDDKPLIAILIGLAIGPPIEAYTQIMKFFHFTTISFAEAVSMMYIPDGSMVLGILSAAGIAAWASLLIYYSARILGTDYFPLKAMLIAMTTQALIFCIFGTLGGNHKLMQGVSGNFVHASAAALAGLLGGYLTKRFLLRENK